MKQKGGTDAICYVLWQDKSNGISFVFPRRRDWDHGIPPGNNKARFSQIEGTHSTLISLPSGNSDLLSFFDQARCSISESFLYSANHTNFIDGNMPLASTANIVNGWNEWWMERLDQLSKLRSHSSWLLFMRIMANAFVSLKEKVLDQWSIPYQMSRA